MQQGFDLAFGFTFPFIGYPESLIKFMGSSIIVYPGENQTRPDLKWLVPQGYGLHDHHFEFRAIVVNLPVFNIFLIINLAIMIVILL